MLYDIDPLPFIELTLHCVQDLVQSRPLADFENKPTVFLVFVVLQELAHVFTSLAPSFHRSLKPRLDLNLDFRGAVELPSLLWKLLQSDILVI